MNNSQENNINITVDGNEVRVPENFTVLEAVQKSGLYIPRLCYLENLKPYGGCRLCMVEIENMRGYPTACTTPVVPDMKIKTKTRELQSMRKEIFKLILSEHPFTCLVCKENQECPEYMFSTRKVSTTTGCNFCTSNGDCELQDLVDYLEIKEVDYPIEYRGVPVIHDNPFYEIDYNLCVLCGRCVRICNEERNSGVLAFVQRGNATLVGTAFNETQFEAGCEYCGACVDVCPTGSLSEKMGRWVGHPDKSTITSCPFCGVGCTMNINTRVDRITSVGPEPGGRTHPLQLCLRGKFVPGDIVHHPDRIQTPLIRKGNNWIEVGWEEAIEFAASNLERYRGNQFGMIASAQNTMEENYILQKFARKVMRSNNVDLFASYPDRTILNTIHNYYLNNPPPVIESIPSMDTILLLGTDASVTHPMVENRIRKAYHNGSDIILANTHFNRSTAFTAHQVNYKPGTIVPLLEFLSHKTGQFKPSRSSRKGNANKRYYSEISAVVKTTGIPEKDIKDILSVLKNPGKLMIIAGDGILRSPDSSYAIHILFSLDKISSDKNGSSLLFLLDEGNRYGGTFAGMHPDFLPGFKNLNDSDLRDIWSENWGTILSDISGLGCNNMINNIREDGITALFITGDLPAHQNLANLKFLIQQNLFLTETSTFADVFFPITVFPETAGHIITLDRKLKEIVPVISRAEELNTVSDTLSGISTKMMDQGFEFKHPRDIFGEIVSFTDITFSEPGTSLSEYEYPKEQPVTRKNGLAAKLVLDTNGYHILGNNLSQHIPDMKSIRSEGILNISPDMIKKLKLNDGDFIRVHTEFGESKLKVKCMTELNGEVAFFTPGWEHLKLVSTGLSPENTVINAKFEKV
ncbi:MAG: molybdopterin-dependent oxidoreductase [Bacteroidales bacterium]|nr:MAG: molybdopterin-dependent oxidoreductase [Bacteroidales bacterium]